MKSKNIIILSLIVLIMLFIIFNASLINIFINKEKSEQQAQSSKLNEIYAPQIAPEDFESKISNKYLTLAPGKRFIYEGKTEEGIERTEVYVTNEKKKVLGVNTIVVRDKVWLNDELIEDTKDWYAQDKNGNVWYFGEDSKEIVDGKVVSTKGSWQAGVNGALPGIVMKANPKAGDIYRQEYYKGEAEDMAEVVSLGVKIKVKYGSFSDCLQTKDWNPLETGGDEYKYYCPEVGSLVYEVKIKDGEGAQLINVEEDSDLKQMEIKEEPFEQLKTKITEQEAIAIAQKNVKGRVTDVGIEKKFGKTAYVVEIDADGIETDVIIDIDTGKVLGIET